MSKKRREEKKEKAIDVPSRESIAMRFDSVAHAFAHCSVTTRGSMRRPDARGWQRSSLSAARSAATRANARGDTSPRSRSTTTCVTSEVSSEASVAPSVRSVCAMSQCFVYPFPLRVPRSAATMPRETESTESLLVGRRHALSLELVPLAPPPAPSKPSKYTQKSRRRCLGMFPSRACVSLFNARTCAASSAPLHASARASTFSQRC